MKNLSIFYFEDNPKIKDLTNFVKRTKKDTMIVFLKKGCTTVISDKDLSIIMNRIEKLLEKYDIFYLSSLMDSCEKKLDVVEKINGLKIVSSNSPNGFYGLASKRNSWEKILLLLEDNNLSYQLNSLVVSGKITALTSWPRIYNTNSNYEFFPCREETIREVNKTPEYELSVYYFMISSLILTIFLFYFPKIFP